MKPYRKYLFLLAPKSPRGQKQLLSQPHYQMLIYRLGFQINFLHYFINRKHIITHTPLRHKVTVKEVPCHKAVIRLRFEQELEKLIHDSRLDVERFEITGLKGRIASKNPRSEICIYIVFIENGQTVPDSVIVNHVSGFITFKEPASFRIHHIEELTIKTVFNVIPAKKCFRHFRHHPVAHIRY